MSLMSMNFLTKIVFDIYDARKCSQLEHVFVSEMYDPKYTQNWWPNRLIFLVRIKISIFM